MIIGVVGRPRTGKTTLSQLLASTACSTQNMNVAYLSDSNTDMYLDDFDLSSLGIGEYEDYINNLNNESLDEDYKKLFITPFSEKLHIGLIGGYIQDMKLAHNIIIGSVNAYKDNELVIIDINAKNGMGNYDKLLSVCNVIICIGMCDNYIYDMMNEYNIDISKNKVLAYKHIWVINRYMEKIKSVKQYDKIITCGQKPIHTLKYSPALKRVSMNGDYEKLLSRIYECHYELEEPTKSALEILCHIYDDKDKHIIIPYGEW